MCRVIVKGELLDLVLVGHATGRVGVEVLELDHGEKAGRIVGLSDGLLGDLFPRAAIVCRFVQLVRNLGVDRALGPLRCEAVDLDIAGLARR